MKKMMKLLSLVLAVVMLLGCLTACGDKASDTTPSTDSSADTAADNTADTSSDASSEGGEITIAFIGNTTGDYAQYGIPVRNAVMLYFDQLTRPAASTARPSRFWSTITRATALRLSTPTTWPRKTALPLWSAPF